MATGTVLFDLAGAVPADGTGTGNNPAQATVIVSAASATPANGPKVTTICWAFDPSVDEHIAWTYRMPENYASGGTLFVGSCPANGEGAAAEAIWKASLAAITPGASENLLTKGFAAPATGSATYNSLASGTVVTTSIVLTGTPLNSVAAGDLVILFLGRDADHTMDDAAGDAIVTDVALEYVTS